MSLFRTLTGCTVAALMLGGSSARAQYGSMGQQKTFVFGLGGGVAVPTADAADFLDNGFNGLGYVRFQPAGLGFALGVNVSFSKFDFSDAVVSTTLPGATSGTQQMLAGLADVRYDLLHGKFRPYVIIGLGAYNLKTETEGTGADSDASTKFGINGGGGVAIILGRVSAFVQARIDNVYTDTGAIDVETIQVVPVTAGIEF